MADSAKPRIATPSDLETRALNSVRKHGGLIREQQSTLSLKQLRRLLEADLQLEKGSLDGLKAEIAEAVDAVLADEAVLGGSRGAADVPLDVMAMVLQQLDHDSFFCAVHSRKAWHEAAAGEPVWEALCQRQGWELSQPSPRPEPSSSPGGRSSSGNARERKGCAASRCQPQLAAELLPGTGSSSGSTAAGKQVKKPPSSQRREQQQARAAQRQQPQQQAMGSDQQQQQQQQEGAATSWRQLYRRCYQQACFECFQPCSRTTLSFAPLRLRLCRECSQGYALPCPQHRLMSKTQAKWRYCLKDTNLAGLPHALDANPIDPAFAPMQLFRRVDVVAAAVAKWGSQDAAAAEHRKRICR